MALINKGTELIVVRDLLGHASVQTTEIYAKLSNHRKREAIEGASQQIVNPEEPLWEANASLKDRDLYPLNYILNFNKLYL
jgi:hypothetical protein